MRRRSRPIGKGFFRVLIWLLALFGAMGGFLLAYQYRTISALYSLARVLSVTESARMELTLSPSRAAEAGLSGREARQQVERALTRLGVKAEVDTR